MQTYFAPTFQATNFTCPHCQVVAAQNWAPLYFRQGAGSYIPDSNWKFCVCTHCGDWSYWYMGNMLVPSAIAVEQPHPEMPDTCKVDFIEAREIVARSPRAAAALLRLAVQKLLPELGEKGENINADIASLVAKGLPPEVQQALDYCRVVGNNAVHPGELNLDDTPEIAHNLFSMLNFIIDDRISRPKRVREFYEKLPAAAKAAIEKRDLPEIL